MDSRDRPAAASEQLRRGQSHESRGELPAALACYDDALARLRSLSLEDTETRRQLGVTWMNRGNVLQKLLRPPESLAAYDRAIALFQTLPFATTPAHRNHLGAAWLNRGHALLTSDDFVAATSSLEHAIAHLGELPLDENPAYRLNLAGAWTNLAHAQLNSARTLARTAAHTALDLLVAHENLTPAFAEMSLRARRAHVTALGELLYRSTGVPPVSETDSAQANLAAETSESIDSALALARVWEMHGAIQLRPLALRLFRLGAQFYRLHQPHFLPEFLLENTDPLSPGAAFAHDADFRATAIDALNLALADLQRPRLLLAGERATEQVLATARSLRAAQRQLSSPNSQLSTSPA